MKQNYERANLAIYAFGAKDVITTSGVPGTDDDPRLELPEDEF